MKLYLYTYASCVDSVSRIDWTQDSVDTFGVFFSKDKPDGQQIALGEIAIPSDALQAAICGRDAIVQRAIVAFDAEKQGLRAECEAKCMTIEKRKQSLLALEAS